MTKEKAEKLRSRLQDYLKAKNFLSYPKLVHLESSDSDEVRVVLHPDEESLKEDLHGMKFSPWVAAPGSNHKSPSKNTDSFGFYPSSARRHVDGPALIPNPSGIRQNPSLQDIVKVYAMRADLKLRLANINSTLGRLHKLERLARAGHGYCKESEHLINDLLDQLKEDGHTGRHKIVRLANKLKSALKADGYSFTKG